METDPARFKGISEELLGNGMDVRISTRGMSMFPLISAGDRITVSPGKDPCVGDIIVFRRGDQMVCHRLVRIFEKDGIRSYQTRGDSFFGLDEPVTTDQILGKVSRIERGHVSIPRKVLLFIHPLLRIGRLNALIINMLIRLKSVFRPVK